MATVLFIPETGELLTVEVDGYKDMQTLVGGLFTVVHNPATRTDVWVNDEGLYLYEYRNLKAEVIADYAPLVGPAFLAMHSPDGDTVDYSGPWEATQPGTYTPEEAWAFREARMAEVLTV